MNEYEIAARERKVTKIVAVIVQATKDLDPPIPVERLKSLFNVHPQLKEVAENIAQVRKGGSDITWNQVWDKLWKIENECPVCENEKYRCCCV